MREEKSNESGRVTGVFVTVPAKIGEDRESVRFWEYMDPRFGSMRKMAEITLPRGTEHNGTDLSYYRFSITENQLDPGGQKYESTHSILLPSENSKQDPWMVNLSRDFGHWLESKDGKRQWIEDRKTYALSSVELREVCRSQYEHYKNNRAKNRGNHEERSSENSPEGNRSDESHRDDNGRKGTDISSDNERPLHLHTEDSPRKRSALEQLSSLKAGEKQPGRSGEKKKETAL